MTTSTKTILVAGASGYVGSRLVSQLLEEGYQVRAMGRSTLALQNRPWARHDHLELFPADVMNTASLKAACEGCDVVFYLVHSMNPTHRDFAEADRLAAQNMVKVAQESGLKRIIYLGGLGDDQEQLSQHLRSRREVAKILHAGSVPVTTLQAAIIIGAGSVAFEILRYLVERLPVMVTPRWINTETQPIAISNVINYLVGCLKKEETMGEIFDIGGPDVVSYRQLFDIYAQEAGLSKRMIFTLPLTVPRLTSYWIELFTHISSALARPLAEGLRNRLICHDHRIREIIPQKLLSSREAIRLALGLVDVMKYHKLLPPEQKYPGDAVWIPTNQFRL